MLTIYKENTEREFATVYFNSITKTVIGPKYGLGEYFQEVLNRIDNLIIEGSTWIIESIDNGYVNISICSPLSGSSHIELLDKLKN